LCGGNKYDSQRAQYLLRRAELSWCEIHGLEWFEVSPAAQLEQFLASGETAPKQL